MPPTNYAFGGGRINTRPSLTAVQQPRLSVGTQDRVAGITRVPIQPLPQRPGQRDTEDIGSAVASKNREINDFGSGITALHQVAAERRRQASQPRETGEVISGGGGREADYSNYQYKGPATGQRAELVNRALSLQGQKYAWGGGGYGVRQSHGKPGGPGSNVVGVDCSGLTSYAYSALGIRLPRTAKQQLSIGYRTAIRNLQPGDLVVWNNGRHTSMYMGNGQIVESVPGKGPRVRALRPGEAVSGVHLKLPGE